MTPAKPGQLTVEVNLPAPGWWNGDTPDTIKDGYEYCMAANIAHRARPGQGRGGQRRLGRAGRRPDQGLRPRPVADLDHRRAQEGGRLLGALLRLRHRRAGEEGHQGRRASIKGLRIGVQQATTGADFVDQKLKPTTPAKVFPDTPSMFTALQAGQIDVAMTDTAIVLGQAAVSNGLFVVVGQYSTGETYGALYPKGSPNEAALDKVIQALVADGTLEEAVGQVPRRRLGRRSDQDPLLQAVTRRSRRRRPRGCDPRARPAAARSRQPAAHGPDHRRAGARRAGGGCSRPRPPSGSPAPSASAMAERRASARPRSTRPLRLRHRHLLLLRAGAAQRCRPPARRSAAARRRHRRRAGRRGRLGAHLVAGYTFGYAAAVFLVRDRRRCSSSPTTVAVGRTFFFLPLIGNSFGLVLEAFWTNVYIFCVAEVLVLVWGLVVAIARLVPGAAGPAGPADRHRLHRHLPRPAGDHHHLSRRLRPAARPACRSSSDFPPRVVRDPGADPDLWRLRRRRSTAPASRASTGARRRPPARSASPSSRRCASSSCRRRCAASSRRCSTTSSALQKDTALVNVIGAIDAFNQAKIVASNHFNLSSVTTVAFLFVLITIPQARFVDRLIERDQRRMRAAAEARDGADRDPRRRQALRRVIEVFDGARASRSRSIRWSA